MPILGPDGKPFDSGPPVSDEVRGFVEQARAIAAQGDISNALSQMAFAFQTDVNSSLVLDTTCELLEQSMKLAGAEQSEELELFKSLRADRQNATLYHQVGNRFFQLQQPALARPFLVRARELAGTELSELTLNIDVDLAQVLMDLGAYQEAIDSFHALNDNYGGLPIWLLLEMGECYALLRQTDEAEAVYEAAPLEAAQQVPGMESVHEEVGDLIARVHDLDEIEAPGLRDWHYVQTRSMLLETNPDENVPGERFVVFQPSEEDVAFLVGVTAAFLDARGYAPNRLLWLGERSEPLARVFAEWWELDEANIRQYVSGDNTSDESDLALLVMAHSYDVYFLQDEQAFADLASAREGLITFALDLRWTERQPLTPDISGFMAQVCNLPWEPRMEVSEDQQNMRVVEETRDARTVAKAIAAQFPQEEECDEAARELMEAYKMCTDLLLDHRDGTLNRRPLMTHSPIKSPRYGI